MKTPGDGHRRLAVAVALGLGAAVAAEARAGKWSMEVEPVYVEVSGHDQHVLTVQRPGGSETVALDTDAALGYRATALYDRARWAYGLDFFIHRTDQGVGLLREAASSPADRRVFEVPNRSFVSTGTGEVLYYQTLEDTTVELWVLDLYARRDLGASDGSPWAVLFGLRNADFDNDYRAIAGIEGVRGTRIDASSNYSRMMGPLVGVVATFARGRHSLEAGLRQSVVFGDIELSRTLRDFVGPPGPFAGPPEEVPPGFNQERLATTDSITVPMTDLLLAWRFRLGEHWSVGTRLGATAWWDLAVPPGVVPDRPEELEETTLLTYGLGVTVGFAF
jgi:hypothetical protein